MKLKRLITSLLIAVLLIGISGFEAGAKYEDFDSGTYLKEKHSTELFDYYTLSFNDNDIAVCAYKGKNTSVTIPEKIDGYTVRYIFSLPEWRGGFFGEMTEKVKEVTLPETLYEIACECRFWFEGDTDCRGVFEGCSRLEKVIFPSSLIKIQKNAFKDCTSLTAVDLSKTQVKTVCGFKNCPKLETVKLPKTCALGSYAFTNCKSLDISLSGVTNLGRHAFDNCTFKSGKIKIGEKIDRLNEAFCGCKGIKEFSISENNKKYTSKNGVVFSKDMKTLFLYPSSKSGKYTVPDKTRRIADGAFYGAVCSEIKLPDSVLEIGESAFSHCKKLSRITLSENLMYIAPKAFCKCVKLTSITIPESVSFIGYDALSGFVSLNKLKVSSAECVLSAAGINTENIIAEGYNHSTVYDYAKRNGSSFSSLGYDRTVKAIKDVKRLKTSLSLSWNEVKNAKGYEVYLSKDGVNFTLYEKTKTNSANIKNLNSATEYFVRIRAVNGKTKYPFSRTYIFLTKPNIKNLKAEKVSDKTLNVSFESDGNSLRESCITVSKSRDFSSDTNTLFIQKKKSKNITLEKGTYYIKVTSYSAQSILSYDAGWALYNRELRSESNIIKVKV